MSSSTRSHIHIPSNLGEIIADAVVGGMGSWKFIIVQTVVVVAWVCSNLYFLTHPYDPYPFILLNLLFSTQAASPININDEWPSGDTVPPAHARCRCHTIPAGME